MVEKEHYDEQGSEAKFNFAKSSLQRIHDLLNNITELEMQMGDKIKPVGQQIKKKFLVKQLFVQSICLLHPDDLKLLKEKVDLLRFETDRNNRMIYSAELNKDLDDVIIDVQVSMQKKGKFFTSMKDLEEDEF